VLSAYLLTGHVITLGMVYITVRYTETLIDKLRLITSEMDSLQRAAASLKRVYELYSTPSKLQGDGTVELPAGPLEVAFQEVTFGYTSEHAVLHDLSFTLAPGKVLGLLGRTAKVVSRAYWHVSMIPTAGPFSSTGSIYVLLPCLRCAAESAWSLRKCSFSRRLSETI
jgi:ABC-type transport system involved in Fe-S cluster assembly fused permease/ATPase subunit